MTRTRTSPPSTTVITREAVLAYLEAQADAVTVRDVAEALCRRHALLAGEAHRATASKILGALVTEGVVRIVGETTQTATGRPARLFRLATQHELPTEGVAG